jgi:hypothetical protein
VKLSASWMAALCVLLPASHLALAQEATLTMKPKEIQNGAGVRLELLLKARPNSAPAALQWEFRIPPGLQIAEIEEGQAAKKAGKTLVCNAAKCIVYGLNLTKIPNGQIAVAKFRVTQRFDGAKGFAQVDPQGRNRKQELQIIDIVAASPDGKVIKVASGSDALGASKR